MSVLLRIRTRCFVFSFIRGAEWSDPSPVYRGGVCKQEPFPPPPQNCGDTTATDKKVVKL